MVQHVHLPAHTTRARPSPSGASRRRLRSRDDCADGHAPTPASPRILAAHTICFQAGQIYVPWAKRKAKHRRSKQSERIASPTGDAHC